MARWARTLIVCCKLTLSIHIFLKTSSIISQHKLIRFKYELNDKKEKLRNKLINYFNHTKNMLHIYKNEISLTLIGPKSDIMGGGRAT